MNADPHCTAVAEVPEEATVTARLRRLEALVDSVEKENLQLRAFIIAVREDLVERLGRVDTRVRNLETDVYGEALAPHAGAN